MKLNLMDNSVNYEIFKFIIAILKHTSVFKKNRKLDFFEKVDDYVVYYLYWYIFLNNLLFIQISWIRVFVCMIRVGRVYM